MGEKRKPYPYHLPTGESNCAQTEKEYLAAVWPCQKFYVTELDEILTAYHLQAISTPNEHMRLERYYAIAERVSGKLPIMPWT